jgi:alpha-beta hydrolase superfamily lysophospholipase
MKLLLSTTLVCGVFCFLLSSCQSDRAAGAPPSDGAISAETRDLIISAPDSSRLAATLWLPKAASRPRPAVVIVHGSGPTTRDMQLDGIQDLVQRGLAVLAYDKRGAGNSEGEYSHASVDNSLALFHQLAGDAAAALRLLRTQPETDARRTGFVGGSQAGWIIPLASAQLDPPPDFLIILSGPAVSIGVEDLYSRLTGEGKQQPQLTDPAEIRRRVLDFRGPHGFDPSSTWAALRVPTLWLLGDLDQSVPTFASVSFLESLRRAGHTEHTVRRYPTAGHNLRDVKTGRMVPALADIEKWLADTVKSSTKKGGQ